MAVYHRCDSDCQNCDLENTITVLNDCMNNNIRMRDNLCQGEMSSCDIPYEDCKNEFVCPKITEVTSCGENGLSGYSTYSLSLIIKNSNVKNIYAIYGDDEGSPKPMIIPPAYQSIVNFNSNIVRNTFFKNRGIQIITLCKTQLLPSFNSDLFQIHQRSLRTKK